MQSSRMALWFELACMGESEMARGWESKAVEQQIEEGKQEAAPRTRSTMTPAERQRVTQLESLRLSRSRLLEQLDKASHPAHREMLHKGLAAVEEQIDTLLKHPLDENT